jgi:hypothetical protein
MNNKNCRVLQSFVTLGLYVLALWAPLALHARAAVALTPATSSAGQLGVSPTSLAFGNQATGGGTAAQSIILTNSGTVAVTLSSITVAGIQADDFAQSNNCGTSLAPGAKCSIAVFFTPVAVGAKSAALTIIDAASGSPHHAALSGTGTLAAGFTVSPASLSFDYATIGSRSVAQTITLTNGGTTAVAFSSIAVTGIQADDFAQSNNCGNSLAAGAACSIAVFFSPVAAGAKSAQLTLAVSAGGSSQHVSLSGTGIAAAGLVISTLSVDFGSAGVGTTSAPQAVTLHNYGNGAIPIASIAVTGIQADDFAQSNNCGTSLGISVTCTISLVFKPVAVGAKLATLTITDSVAGSPQHLPVFGTGLIAAPSALSYLSPQTFTAGTAISRLSPTVTGMVSSYYVQPALPTGLVLDPVSGQITGTPTTVTPAANYLITAVNGTGSTSFSIGIAVRLAAPSALSYRARKTYNVGAPIVPLAPSVTGVVQTYSVSPALPKGLSLNTITGVISGIPSGAQAAAGYIVTASNSTGSTSYKLSITVVLTAPQSLSYPSPQSLAIGLPIASLSPFVVGMVATYSVSPALPAGLSLDGKTGVITGTPTMLAPAATFTVTATNASGSTTFGLVIAVATVGVAPAQISRLVAAGTPLVIQLAMTSQSLTGTLYVVASDPSNLFVPASTVTATASGYAVTLKVSTTIAAGHYSGNAVLKLCRDPACANGQMPGSISIPFNIKVLSASSAWAGDNIEPLAAWNGIADWTMFQGNAAHTGYVPVSVDPNSFSTRWQGGPSLNNTPNDYNGAFAYTLTTDGGQLYVASGTKLFALNELDASQVWSYDVSALQYPSVNPPAEANGTVYMAAGQQSSTYLFAFDEITGQVLFQSLMSSQWEHYFAPTVGTSGVYTNAGTYGGLYGFSFTGNPLFFDGLPQTSQWTPAVDNEYVYTYTGSLVLADPVSGLVRSSIQDPTYLGGYVDGSAVLGASGSVFAANYGDGYGGEGNTLLNFDPATQTVRWEKPGSYGYNPAYHSGVLYAANNAPYRLEARRESDGALLWTWSPPQPEDVTFNSEVLLTNSIVFVSTNLATYGIDTTTHQLVFSYPFAGRLALSSNGILYIQGIGPIVAINLK